MIDVGNVPRNVSIGGARLRLEHGRSRAPSIEIRCLSAETMPKVETGAHNAHIEVRVKHQHHQLVASSLLKRTGVPRP